MTTSQEIDARITGQNVPIRFLANLDRSRAGGLADADALRWRTADGGWSAQSLEELATTTARLTTALRERGVAPGDRVVMMMRNRPEFHAVDLAVLFAGATPVSIYNSSAPDQIEYVVNDCGATMAIVEDTGFLERVLKVRESMPTLRSIAIVDDDELVPADVHRYDDLVASDPADLETAAQRPSLDDLATIIYTSGTTGPPKGVMLTHRNIVWTLESIGDMMREQAEIDDLRGKRHISYLPMAHVMERLLGHYYLVDFGTEVTCCPDTSKVAEYARDVHPHLFIGVPRVWEKLYAGVRAALAADPDKERQFGEAVEAAIPIVERTTDGSATDEDVATWDFLDEVAFRNVRGLIGLDEALICISGAAPLNAEILSWFRAIGVPLTEGYGMSETTAVLSWAAAAKAGYVGRAAPGVEVQIAEDGEVLARGGNMFVGYLGQPEKTADTIDEDGWVHTGDIGELDDDGYLRIVDRKKELIITAGGKNVSPANLEAALKMIPLVGQACAVGDGRPFVAALVVLDPDASASWAAAHGLTGDDASMPALAERPDVIAEIDAGVREVMEDFNNAESVKKVRVLGDEWLPDSDLLTPTSKLKRRGILTRFAADIEALYAR